MESYPLASLITDRGTGSSSASGSRDEHAPIADAADDGGRDLLLEFTSECELEAGAPEIAVDVSDVDDALMGEFEADYTPLSLHALVVTAPAIPPITVRSRLTTDWQMQAARAAIVVRRRTWTVQRLSRSVVSGFSRTVGFIRTASFSRTAGFSATSALTRDGA